ncbi:OmpP1/FadL family transporter [Sulfitobacter sp.]|uniref:OmpP1/FadL family transporter n=1 Tax=Sulfitobacter sp. TaxID=1903071 RepID=UPI003F6C6AC6|tara:strand:+ start:1238 stop:2359 length:1122 start_codon:yes stop_codon:yes gene_type:complete
MKYTHLAIAALISGATTVHAGGLDRSNQDIGIIFESGNRFELSFGNASPSIDGTDIRSGGQTTGNVAGDFNILSGALRYKLSDQLSVALIVDEPFGSDISYPAIATSPSFGGTQANVDSFAMTALARYNINSAFSVHGGLRYQEIEAAVTLRGAGYGGLSGYRGDFESDGAVGYVLGAAFEKPELAMRVALTYQSRIRHDLVTTETINGAPVTAGPSSTRVETPESLNLEFQSGVAKDTLVFGSIRYARHSDTIVSPAFFASQTGGASLTDIEDSTDYEIGIGRRFSDQWSGSVAFGYQTENGDDLVSPLSPTDGARYISVGAKYQATEQFDISVGVRYTKLGDARAATQNVGQATFADNSAVSVGVKMGYNF